GARPLRWGAAHRAAPATPRGSPRRGPGGVLPGSRPPRPTPLPGLSGAGHQWGASVRRPWPPLAPWLLSAALLIFAHAQGPAGEGAALEEPGIFIDPTQVVGEVGPYVYGANYGPLSAIAVDQFELAAASGIEFLRFPGGAWGD